MPAKLLEAFLEAYKDLRKPLSSIIMPLDYVEDAAKAREEKSLQEVEVDLGPQTIVVRVSSDPAEAVKEIAKYKANAEELITDMADSYLQSLDEDSAIDTCKFPEIENLRKLHAAFPVFGFPIAMHDVNCSACNSNDDMIDARIHEAELAIENLSEADQQLLVTLGFHLVDILFKKKDEWSEAVEEILGYKLENPRKNDDGSPKHFFRIEDLSMLIDGPFQALHHWHPCPISDMEQELLIWYLRYPYFLKEGLFRHVLNCEDLKRRYQAYEQEALNAMPQEIKQEYLIARKTLTEIDSYFPNLSDSK